MAMARNNIIDVLARFMRTVVEDLPLALLAVGVATCATVSHALPVAGGRRVWLVACFFCGVDSMWASFWVSADVRRRRATGQVILATAVLNLLVAIGLSGFEPQIALNIIGAMVD